MATYKKVITETEETFYADLGNVIMMQKIVIDGENVTCSVGEAVSLPGLAENSSEEEYNEVGDEILVFARVGTHPPPH